MPEQTAEPTPRPLFPGDLVQIVERAHGWYGVVALVAGTPSWGCQLEQHGPNAIVTYGRAVVTEAQLVGVAAILPPEIAASRRDAIMTWQATERERIGK